MPEEQSALDDLLELYQEHFGVPLLLEHFGVDSVLSLIELPEVKEVVKLVDVQVRKSYTRLLDTVCMQRRLDVHHQYVIYMSRVSSRVLLQTYGSSWYSISIIKHFYTVKRSLSGEG